LRLASFLAVSATLLFSIRLMTGTVLWESVGPLQPFILKFFRMLFFITSVLDIAVITVIANIIA